MVKEREDLENNGKKWYNLDSAKRLPGVPDLSCEQAGDEDTPGHRWTQGGCVLPDV
jgi:hypothetical protein